ncbi:MAG: hypothetical protein AAF125_24080 [Chloroflexota bacterium]
MQAIGRSLPGDMSFSGLQDCSLELHTTVSEFRFRGGGGHVTESAIFEGAREFVVIRHVIHVGSQVPPVILRFRHRCDVEGGNQREVVRSDVSA